MNIIIEKIAANETDFLNSLFNPILFSDGSKGTYNGHIVRKYKNHIRFTYMDKKNLLVNKSGVIGQYSITPHGTHYFHVLDPFGANVCFSASIDAGKELSLLLGV